MQSIGLVDEFLQQRAKKKPMVLSEQQLISALFDIFQTKAETRSPDQRAMASDVLSVCLASVHSLKVVDRLMVKT